MKQHHVIDPLARKDIEELRRNIEAFELGKMDEEKFKAYRLTRGVYGQRQSGVQMFRTKIPFGRLNTRQLGRLAEVSDRFSTGNLHLTTRQNIQMHHVKLADSPAVWEALAEVEVTAREACGNTVRNITASAIAGIDPEEPYDVSPYVEATYQHFLRNPICQDMGRKIKIAFSSSEQDSAFAYFHDFGFIPRIQDEVKGFKVLLAGGLGAQSMIAHTVSEFMPADQIMSFMEAAIRIFDRYGERSKRFKARMKFLVKKMGLDTFLDLIAAEQKGLSYQNFPIETSKWQAEGAPAIDLTTLAPIQVDATYDFWRETNVFEQKQEGYYGVALKIPLGDLSSDTARKLIPIVQSYAADDIRITVNQGLVLRYVREAVLPHLYTELKQIGLAEPGFDSLADITACPGTDTCNLAVSNSTHLSLELERVIKEDYKHLIANSHLKIKISGCMNACGQHMAANIGLHGSSIKHKDLVVPAMQIVLGGGINPAGQGHIAERVIKLPSKKLPDALKVLLEDYEEKALEGEYYNDYFRRLGKRYFYQLLKPLANLEVLQKSDYQDWGQEEFFQPEVGVGECAGVAYDVVGGILQDAADRLAEGKEMIQEGHLAESIYLSYSAFVIGAKALLLAKDIACNTHRKILDDFHEHYVQTELLALPVSSDFSSWVLRMNQQSPNAAFATQYSQEAEHFLIQLKGIRKNQLEGNGEDKVVVGHHYQA
ncbi:MAG: nitrite/sulfite reductase [Bacteroidota bacterium]